MHHEPVKKWTLPFCCIRYTPSRSFLRNCMRGILQYVVVRPAMAIASGVMFATDTLDEGHFRVDRGPPPRCSAHLTHP
jgi:hypothetical protein